jgi:hypothetical protein
MHIRRLIRLASFIVFTALALVGQAFLPAKIAFAQSEKSEKPPHGQDTPPGPALSPEEAI